MNYLHVCNYIFMDYELITAVSKNGIIGRGNDIPWYIPEDMTRFYKLTKGHILIMGRKTFESLPKGPLKNRVHIIMTNKLKISSFENPDIFYCSMDTVSSVVNALQKIKRRRVFVIGGSDIYKLFFDKCSLFHITYIERNYLGDTYFPYEINEFPKDYNLKTLIYGDSIESRGDICKTKYIQYVRKSAFDNIMELFDLRHSPTQEDGLYDGKLLPQTHTEPIVNKCLLYCIPGIYAYMNGAIHLSAVSFTLGLSSFYYWKNPTYKDREYYMNTITHVALIGLQTYSMQNSQSIIPYIAITGMSTIFSIVGDYFRTSHSFLSAYFYSMVPVLNTVGNIVLYSS